VAEPFWHNLVPDGYYRSIYDIDLDALRERGVSGLIIDLDNTVAAWGVGRPEPRLAEWIREVRDKGLEPYILSNDLGPRVDLFTRYLGIEGTARAGKPRRRAFRKAVEALGLRPDQVAVIGDQVFTDIVGAKRLGCHTILVVPVSRREFLWTRLVRLVEGRLLAWLRKRGLVGPPVGKDPGLEGE